jgi:hypothetical protein
MKILVYKKYGGLSLVTQLEKKLQLLNTPLQTTTNLIAQPPVQIFI